MSETLNGWTDLYHPIEHSILSEYLGVAPLVPLEGIDNRKNPRNFETYICVEPDSSGSYGDLSLTNAVARICLEMVQHELPQWGQVQANGQVVLGREYRLQANRPVGPMPRHLFTINWANSGPGYSWPEAYHVTYLLGYHQYVVTAAQDSPDAFGYTEFAIGHFPAAGDDVEEKSGEIIRRWWSEQMAAGAPWEEFLDKGMIDRETAEDWALETWGYRTHFEGDLPYWYEERLTGEFDLHETRLDQHMIRRFKRLVDAGAFIDELPDDVRDWWANLA